MANPLEFQQKLRLRRLPMAATEAYHLVEAKACNLVLDKACNLAEEPFSPAEPCRLAVALNLPGPSRCCSTSSQLSEVTGQFVVAFTVAMMRYLSFTVDAALYEGSLHHLDLQSSLSLSHSHLSYQ